MDSPAMMPFSILDLSPIPQGATAGVALRNSLELAQHAEALGFQRYWLAEHHNMPGIASAATSVVIGHIAGGTKIIRVGSGGVMLPNHAPLVIAEQFGTLAALYPGRIDLGLGRAPGTDGLTMRALRRSLDSSVDQFPRDVQELQIYFGAPLEGQRVHAYPGVGSKVPIWLLGSSLYSAELAAIFGLPFAFASHFAPELMEQAIHIYRSRFTPSEQLKNPHVMLTVNVLAAATDAEAQRQFTSQQQSFINLRRGAPGQVPPPIDDIETYWTPMEKIGISQSLARSFVGSAETVENGLREFVRQHRPDELMVTAHIFDQRARLNSIELVSQMREAISLSPVS
ncbi:LLM class flavin-dependent oxidoreductase [soil metagenome]